MKDEYSRVRKIVDDYFRLVRKLMTGEGTVPEYVLRRMKLEGKKIEGLIPRMAKYGAAMFPEGDAKAAAKNLKEQVEAAQTRVDLALDNSRTKTLQTAQNAMAAAVGIAVGAALFGLAAEALRGRREEFASDWSRTAHTEMHEAKEHGALSVIQTYPDGDDTLVYKQCQPDACARCISAYQNPDGTPKIFTIGELRRNGSNIGRKPNEWLPVIGCMHPHCRCSLELVGNQTLMPIRKGTDTADMEDLYDTFLNLGDDTPERAQIAYDIMSKAVNRTDLVRVQRTITRNGKSFVTHVWVLPNQVKRTDLVLQRKGDNPTQAQPHKKKSSVIPKDSPARTLGIDENILLSAYAHAHLNIHDDLTTQESRRKLAKGIFYAHGGSILQSERDLQMLLHRTAKKQEKKADSEYMPKMGWNGPVPPPVAATALWELVKGDTSAIQQQVIHPDWASDPLACLCAESIKIAVQNSGSEQEDDLYIGMQVSEAFLVHAMQTNTVNLDGIMNVTGSIDTARTDAGKAPEGSLGIVVELPQNMHLKTLQTASGKDMFAVGGPVAVSHIEVDDSGTYHITCTNGRPKAGSIADADTYAKCGIKGPPDDALPELTDDKIDAFLGNHGQYAEELKVDNYYLKHLPELYSDYGWDGAVKYMEYLARHSENIDRYNEIESYGFAETRSGYDPALLELARKSWTSTDAYGYIRDAETAEVTTESDPFEIACKVYSEALNAHFQTNGTYIDEKLSRGLGLPESALANLHVGSSFDLGAMSSFSSESSIAADFAYYSDEGMVPVFIQMGAGERSKRHTKAISVFSAEAEYLVANDNYVITSIDDRIFNGEKGPRKGKEIIIEPAVAAKGSHE